MNDYKKIIEIAKTLGLTPADLKRAYDFWVVNETSVAVTPKPKKSIENITAEMDRDSNLKYLYKQAQTLLGKMLSATDVQILYSFYDDYGFSVEAIAELLVYAAKIEKRNMRYIEKIAIDWAEKGLFTHDELEPYIKKLEQRAKREGKIRQALGIDRKLTQTEEQFIGSWANELKVPLELIPLAYERTINGIGKLSCAYMDKIFKNWLAAGIKTAAQVEAQDAEFKFKQSPTNNSGGNVQKSKFNNFAGTSGVDYAEAANRKINRSNL